MLCKCHWIVLYTVHFTAFCLGGPFFPGHGVYLKYIELQMLNTLLIDYLHITINYSCNNCSGNLTGRQHAVMVE